jgi:hypothetical protein
MFGMLKERDTATAVSEILEIRVHGVRNTPPAEMLETTPEDITRDRGDDLGSFWRRKDDGPANGIERTEAFWWGAQARTGGGALAAIGRVFVHLGWFLLLPFALANLAYWTREIKPQEKANDKYWDGDSGAATVRIFALLLTLLAVAAFSSVAIDLVAVQCFRRPADETESGQVCAALPAALDGFRDLGRDSRAALFGLIPIAVILLLYVIGRRGRVHFEERIQKFAAGMQDYEDEPGVPLLATGGFWSQSRIGRTSEWLHVAASVAMVTFLLALDAAYMNDPNECWRRALTAEDDPVADAQTCLAQAATQPIPFWFGLGSLVLLVIVVLLVWRASHTRDGAMTELKRGLSMACLAVSIAGFVAWTILTFTPLMPPPDDDPRFLGLIVAPLFLVTAAFLLALAGVGWKARRPSTEGHWSPDWWRRPLSAVLLTLAGVALLSSHVLLVDNARWILVAIAVGLLLLHLWIAWSVPVDHRHQGWRGQGAAVAMLLGLFASMALSSLLVLGTAFWLGTPADAGEVDDIWRTPADASARPLDVPNAYERFAVLLTAIALLMVILVLVAMTWNLVRLVSFTIPQLRRAAADERDFEQLAGIEHPGLHAYPPRMADTDPRRRRRVTVRRSSHLMHRGEPIFGWLAVFAAIGFLSLSAAVVFETIRDAVEEISPALPEAIRIASNAALAFVAVTVVAAVAAHAAASSERPLGVFWDVVAFFPRAGHPFAPPCYGERVVPELSARTRAWMEVDTGNRPRAVMFTAHSMGSTICTATILALRGETITRGRWRTDLVTDHVAMLSYGTQLRAYFSRFFPSVFGNAALGVPGTVGPSLWLRDPWARQVNTEFSKDYKPKPGENAETTLTGMLGSDGRKVPRWRSLWRRTDYLGFPVYSYRGEDNPIDLGATESVPASYLWRIATHSDYLGTPQYEEARDELIAGLGGRPNPPPDSATATPC